MLKLFFIQIPSPDLFISEYSDIRKLVSEHTWSEAMGFRSKKTAAIKVIGELIIRYGLNDCFGIRGNDFNLIRGEHGKPYVEGVADVFFNLSHSGDYIICAVSDKEVGVDIERRSTPRLKVSTRFFEEREKACLSALTGDEQAHLFFNYWSIKESFLKYTGSGLSRSLSSFYVDMASINISIYEGDKRVPVFIHACPVDAAYSCFICSAVDEAPELVSLSASFYTNLLL